MGEPGVQVIRVSVESDPKYLGPLRTVISESTAILGLDEEVTGEIVLAVTEACANIIRHCYGGKPGERIDVMLRFGPDFYEVRIDDYGEFVDPAEMKGRKLEDVQPGGLGLHFIHSVMDDVEYRKNRWGGTTLTMTKSIEPAAPSGGIPGAED